MTKRKMAWTPMEKASQATKEVCKEIETYKKLLESNNKEPPDAIELTPEAWKTLNSSLLRCEKVATIRRHKVMPIYHITIHGFSLYTKKC